MTRWMWVSVVLVGCVYVREGSGVSATERVEIPASVDAVRARVSLDVTVRAGESPSVTVTCDDNLIDDVVVAWDEAGELTLDHASPGWMQPRTDCSAVVVVAGLREVKAQGSGGVWVEGDHALEEAAVNGSGDLEFLGELSGVERLAGSGSGALRVGRASGCEVAVEVTGSGPVEIEELRGCEVRLFQSGSGELTVAAGEADGAKVDVLGSGDLLAGAFVVDQADILVTGSGDVDLTVRERVQVRVVGSGDVTVRGRPHDRDVETPGSGEVAFP